MRAPDIMRKIVFLAMVMTFCMACIACARKTLTIRLPADNPAWREVGETINSANSVLRQLENNPDNIAITWESQDEKKVKAAEEAAFYGWQMRNGPGKKLKIFTFGMKGFKFWNNIALKNDL